MSAKNLIAGVALTLVVASAIVTTADAKGRKCPRGYEDIGGRCVPDPTPGATSPIHFEL